MNKRRRVMLLVALVSGFSASSAHAQFAVVDVGAIAQLVQQVQTMQQQLETARYQLEEARETLNAMRGRRGMERLLAGTDRNYLPSSWSDIQALMQGGGTNGAMAADLRALLSQNAVLSEEDLARFADVDRARVDRDRRAVAMLQVTTRRALQTTSERFSNLQRLIDAIPQAGDQKAILDLQARIAAEQAMLANEQAKLQVLQQMANAEEIARRQRVREEGIASMGSLRRLPPMGL